MCQNSSDPNQPDIGTFHTHFDVVFVDSTGYHNLCSHMLESTYNRVRDLIFSYFLPFFKWWWGRGRAFFCVLKGRNLGDFFS